MRNEYGIFGWDNETDEDSFEQFVNNQRTAGTREESLYLTGDDSFFCGEDDEESDEE